jgi:hypothetical protein
MATLQQKIKCERDAREMLAEGGLPEPDRVEYGHTCIRLFWEETKVVLVVDIDEPPEDMEALSDGRDDFADLLDGLEDDDGYSDDFEEEDVRELLGRLDHDDREEEAA